ncbi:MAG: GntR family transcriptional regulator [Cryobacterium sp.]|nr:GntR family transcriptional regulator [Cryobacterium sp.]
MAASLEFSSCNQRTSGGSERDRHSDEGRQNATDSARVRSGGTSPHDCSGRTRSRTASAQDRLAARLGVSRVPIWEALSTLGSEEHVAHEPHHGCRVARLSITDLLEVDRISGDIRDGGSACRHATDALEKLLFTP